MHGVQCGAGQRPRSTSGASTEGERALITILTNVSFEYCAINQLKGPSTRVRICIQIAVRFRAQFVPKQNRDPLLFLSPITMVCLYISSKKIQKLTCWTPLAANRTPNRAGIRMENCTCRRPLSCSLNAVFHDLRGLVPQDAGTPYLLLL
jgi:hypothetical protein